MDMEVCRKCGLHYTMKVTGVKHVLYGCHRLVGRSCPIREYKSLPVPKPCPYEPIHDVDKSIVPKKRFDICSKCQFFDSLGFLDARGVYKKEFYSCKLETGFSTKRRFENTFALCNCPFYTELSMFFFNRKKKSDNEKTNKDLQ